jgi:hypothetical protein
MLTIYRLPNQLPGEKVIKIIRKDLFILLKKIALCMLLILLPLLFLFFLISTYPDLFEGAISQPIIILGVSAYYLFVWLFFFFSFIDYYLDVWIITSDRILDIRQEGFFSRTISEQKIFRIQDVTSETKGIMPTLMHYGEVYVQTAAEQQRFHFHEIPFPEQIRDIIIKLAQSKRTKQVQKELTSDGV